MDNNELNKLEALAKAAEQMFTGMHWYTRFQILDGISNDESAAFIGALAPDTVLELIALARAGLAAPAEPTREKQLEAVVRAACDDLTKIHDALGLEEGGTIDADIMALRIHHLRTARPDFAAPTGQQQCDLTDYSTPVISTNTALAAPTAAEGPSTVLAWAHEDGRVVAASTMDAARSDGGAMRSSLAGYTIPLGRIAAPAAPQSQQEGAGEVDAARLKALHAAVAAIYFDDSSDFRSALGSVVRHLDPALAGDLLGSPKAAYDKVCAALSASTPAVKE